MVKDIREGFAPISDVRIAQIIGIIVFALIDGGEYQIYETLQTKNPIVIPKYYYI